MSSLSPLFERSHILIGDQGVSRLQTSHVLIAGIGGVGSFVAEALARLGVGQLTLVDHDVVSSSNLNRQLVALHSTLEQNKIEVMAKRIQDINPDCQVTTLNAFLSPDSIPELLTQPFDLVVDAIDSMSSKTALLANAWQEEIPIFSSMGAGGKLDPSQIRTGDLMDTSVCKLASQLRRHVRKRGVGRGIQTVYSIESALSPLPPEAMERGRARAVNGTVSYMPSLFGLTLAGLVANHIIGDARRDTT
jgi:tRNA A37 threonylcarbamoyladenosine dehydratase